MQKNSKIFQTNDVAHGAYKFSPNKLLTLIKSLAERGALSDEEAQHLLKMELIEGYRRYKNFLRSAELVTQDAKNTVPTETLKYLWQALLEEKTSELLKVLLKATSFRELYTYVREQKIVPIEIRKGKMMAKNGNFPIADIAVPNYLNIGEVAEAWLVIPDTGIAIADNTTLESAAFSKLAIETYKTIQAKSESEWVLTGQWLEELVLQHRVHPVLTRKLLEKARQLNLLRIYVEGSTPDTRFDQHTMWILKSNEGNPKLIKVYLYHGDFLIPGTASVRLSIQGV